jgi:predicted Zn-dependent protease
MSGPDRSRFWLGRILAVMILVVLASVSVTRPATAQTFIRDAEIEATIRGWATPLLLAAGLSPRDVQFHIVQSDELNAFVAGGMRIFIYTGLLRRAKSPEEIIGVLAHEIGHIRGGHLARFKGEYDDASAKSILFTVLGVAAAIASGDPRVGLALGAFGQTAALKSLLKYSRTQESAADQAALNLLDATKQSASGLSSFLEVLGNQELLLPEQQDPYLRTHPISRERIDALKEHLRSSPYSTIPASPTLTQAHARLHAKLEGFLAPIGKVLRDYSVSDSSAPALIARAVAYHRSNRIAEADQAVAELLAANPRDAYAQELQGQIRFERGDNTGAIQAYAKAVEMAPDEPLIAIAYAQALVVEPNGAGLPKAVKLLETAVAQDRDNASAWRTLGTAYGRQGKLGEAALALAESEMRFDRPDLAFQQASRAQTILPKNSPAWLRAEDIRQGSERLILKREEERPRR